MLTYGKKYPVDGMLSDITNQGIIAPDNRKWFEKEMMPLAVEAGLKRGAIVTSGNAFKLYYINTKLFNNQKDAYTWLESFPVSTHTLT